MNISCAALALLPHHVDHLIPFCDLFDAQLLCLDYSVLHPALNLYSYKNVSCLSEQKSAARALGEKWLSLLEQPHARETLESYDVIFYSHLFARQDLRRFFGGRKGISGPRVVYCPHGFSEKNQRWSAAAAYQDVCTFYGAFNLTQLENWGVRNELGRYVTVGNPRQRYADQNSTFFEHKLQELGIARDHSCTTMLYAPTWKDALKLTSAFSLLDTLCRKLPDQARLIIKPHPLIEDSLLRKLVTELPGSHRVTFLRSVTLTFPILALADVYIGDMSSLAYDYLYFQRPMVFLNQADGGLGDAKNSELFGCGSYIGPNQYHKVYDVVTSELELSDSRQTIKQKLYNKVYEPGHDEEGIKRALLAIFQEPPPAWMSDPAYANGQ